MAAAPLLAVPPAAIRVVHYVYPTAVFVWFLASQAAAVCTMANLSAQRNDFRKRLFVFLQLALIVSYVGEAVLQCMRSLIETGWWSSQDNVIYLLTSIVAWGVVELAMLDTQTPVWHPYYGSWFIAVTAEACLLSLSLATNAAFNKFEVARFGIQGLRMLVFAAAPLGVWAVRDKGMDSMGQESEPLLGSGPAQPPTYGTSSEADLEAEEARNIKSNMLKKIEASGNWWTYAKSYAIFWEHIWPKSNWRLQICMLLVGFCLLAQRGLNVMVPHQLGVVTNALMGGNGRIPWSQLTFFIVFRWLDSTAGVAALQSYLWIPIDQFSHRSLTVASYNHVMSLSYDYHTGKKTGDVWSSITQGRSVNGFIESILFQVVPMLVDLVIAFGYFFWAFGTYMALIVAVVSISYLWITFKLSAMRNDLRRNLNMTSRNEINILIETVSSWTTVSYFNRVPYEQNRYYKAIGLFQKAERKWLLGVSVLNVAQSLTFTVGLLAASFLAVYEVTIGSQPVGSFVTLLSYWAQLAGPLGFFANFYRRIQIQMLDAERLLALFQVKPSVEDRPHALELDTVEGTVDFENVCFSYDSRKPAIRDVSFHVPAGTTVAFVGETGGGKTTCLKLLFRFYDIASGAIKIDGHDIRDIKLSSLRNHLGVVPQDPQLFSDTIMNNLKYANFDATDEEVYEACRAASIHEKILSFPDGYLSQVGERGVRLSGGELQRVAIARAILKDPKIILLDEATSMIDMETERQIQDAFQRLAKNRTMFVVAHRLSTIMDADLIIVIKDGRIAEQGTHDELLEAEGMYRQLWSKQLRPEVQPSPKPKGSRLIEDLLASADSDDATKPAAPSSQLIEIPEALKRSTAPQSTVTFSLPERTVWNPQFLFQPATNPLNPRIAAPSHGILKHTTAVKVAAPSFAGDALTVKSATVLKPDAKEFVPKGIPVIASEPAQKSQQAVKVQTPAPASPVAPEEPVQILVPSEGVTRQEKEVDISRSETENEGIDSKTLDSIQNETHTNAGKTAAQLEASAAGGTDSPVAGDESSGEGAITGDPDADSPQEFKKRRRRIRRRNSKAKSTEKDGNTDTKPMETIADIQSTPSVDITTSAVVELPAVKTPPSMKENEQPHSTAGENSGAATGSIGKAKRRFRNGNKTKGNAAESENDGGPLSVIRPLDNVAGQLRPRTRSLTGFTGKEDQAPLKRSESVSSPIKQQFTQQRRNSGSLKRASIDKGQKKPKNSSENDKNTATT